MSFKVVDLVLASAVANSGTVTSIPYPAGTNQAYFTGANAAADGVVTLNDNEVYTQAASKIGITYGASDITLTNSSGVTWAAGTRVRLQLGRAGNDRPGFAPSAAIAALTDSSGGTASTTLPAISASPTQAEVRNSIASLNAQIERLRIAMQSAGITL